MGGGALPDAMAACARTASRIVRDILTLLSCDGRRLAAQNYCALAGRVSQTCGFLRAGVRMNMRRSSPLLADRLRNLPCKIPRLLAGRCHIVGRRLAAGVRRSAASLGARSPLEYAICCA
ncbi:hypothetical protein F511_45699 [Dorcoceras hygrometricum]|uniref:Uncharacterized protein n=1 Tax=Dorcoceras hygrometricum TaxID=472368 RepID=A0A2Z6ZVA4_9LAMI|nr:hypothetical protein F511_45699 [Dorcoceras hygrometricum]